MQLCDCCEEQIAVSVDESGVQVCGTCASAANKPTPNCLDCVTVRRLLGKTFRYNKLTGNWVNIRCPNCSHQWEKDCG